MWPTEFEQVLRTHLALPPKTRLEPEGSLADYGLDSMTTVSVLVDLEETFAIVIPDELLVSETFQTAGALWQVLSGLLAQRSRPG